MKRCVTGALVALGVSVQLAQAAAYVVITLPKSVRSETVFARYVLDDDFGGWLQPQTGVSSYFISTKRRSGPASRFRAIVYAPGCMIQTIDLPNLGPDVLRVPFACQILPKTTLTGVVVNPERIPVREMSIQVKYVARWAQRFLGFDEAITDFTVGSTRRTPAGERFEISLPDFAAGGGVAGYEDHPGEFRLLGRDAATGQVVARIVPLSHILRTRMGGLQIRNDYSGPIEFAACSAPREGILPRDDFGFTLRAKPGDSIDMCAQ